MQTKSLIVAIALSIASFASASTTMERRGRFWQESTIADAIDTNSALRAMDVIQHVEELFFESCIQTELLTEAVGKCDPANSKGFRSVHNCQTKANGKYYYCQTAAGAACFKVGNSPKNYENGECFL